MTKDGWQPISLRMSFGAATKDLWRRFRNKAPEPSSGVVREGGDDKFWKISLEPFERETDWTVMDEAKVEPKWTEEQLTVGFAAFNAVVMETADQVRKGGLFDQEIWGAIRGAQTIETVVMHGELSQYPYKRVSAREVWELYGVQIPSGEIPIMMAEEGYGRYENLWRVGAGKGCGMAILVSDDQSLRKQWIDAVVTGLDAHWPGTITGAVLSESLSEPVLNLESNRAILPIHGGSAKQALGEFRSGANYPGKRILIADLGRVGRVNADLLGEIVAAAREGKNSGDVGVVATMSVADYVDWQRSLHRYWSRALHGAGLFTGGFTDMDAAERVARAFSGGKNSEMAIKLMGLKDTAVAMLAGIDQIVEGWLLS